MPSQALQKWLTVRATPLDDIEDAHRFLRGTGPGTRAASLQINQAYVVLLAAQFQGFSETCTMNASERLSSLFQSSITESQFN